MFIIKTMGNGYEYKYGQVIKYCNSNIVDTDLDKGMIRYQQEPASGSLFQFYF